LVNGEHLAADEFRQRYSAMPPSTRAELVDGEVFLPSPVRKPADGSKRLDLAWFLTHYRAYTPGSDSGYNCTVRLCGQNEVQPTVSLIVRPEYGGQVAFDAGGFILGAPELVAEVAVSSVGIDRKFEMYRRFGVREYIIHRTEDEALDWFALRGRRFVSLVPDKADGLLKSQTFPGLWLDAPALIRRDLLAVLSALTRGVQSPEHAKFVKQLAKRRGA